MISSDDSQPEPDYASRTNLVAQRRFRFVVIGAVHRREFQPFLKCLVDRACAWREFVDIASALTDPDAISDADLTVVLQSWSDQFQSGPANHLIGRTLFKRLLCCYSVSCESDGRNRSVWPDAVRVPLRLAAAVVERELFDIERSQEPLPVTAAPDEVFGHRSRALTSTPGDACHPRSAVVVGPDVIYRRTVATVLREQGFETSDIGLITNPQRDFRELSAWNPMIVIHDLDPWSTLVNDSINAARQRFQNADFFGVATMPDGGLRMEIVDQEFAAIIPRLDIWNGLCWQIRSVNP